jgi:hypothetical protein
LIFGGICSGQKTTFKSPIFMNFGLLDFCISVAKGQDFLAMPEAKFSEKYSHVAQNYFFVGLCFDAQQPQASSLDLLQQLDFNLDLKDLLAQISNWAGHFCLVFHHQNQLWAINDAGAQQEVYYAQCGQKMWISSQPHFILPHLPEAQQNTHAGLPKSWIDAQQSLFQHTIYTHVFKLIPNFILNVDNCQMQRFAPSFSPEGNLESVAKTAFNMLENSILAMAKRADLAIALTAGWDSRLLLTAAKNVDNKHVYILDHATTYTQVDKKIAQEITDILGLKLNIIAYQDQTPQPLNALWKQNPRNQMLAELSQQHFPHHFIINGNVSEVVRGFYDPLPTKLSAQDLLYILGLEANPLVEQWMASWMKSCQEVLAQGHFSLLDLLYWEHKMPNWAGEAKTVAQYYGICLSPFNQRNLLQLLASVPRENRQKLQNVLYAKMLSIMAPELSQIPINPTKKENKIRLLQKLKLYGLYRWLLFKMKRLKF